MEKKRGVSPVVATVLLIAMVIIIGLIIFLWFRGFQEETITKFGGTNIKLVCNEVDFDVGYSGGVLSLSNFGNVPIYEIEAKIMTGGDHEIVKIDDISAGWPETGLTQGTVFSDNVGSSFSGADTVLLIPVLRGTSERGEQVYTCDENYGKKITL